MPLKLCKYFRLIDLGDAADWGGEQDVAHCFFADWEGKAVQLATKS